MATQSTNLIVTATVGAKKRIFATFNKVAKFKTAGADKLLPKGTVVSYESTTDRWIEWATGGANDVGTPRGIVWPDDVTILLAGEVLGVVMLRGMAHVDDLISDGGTTAQLKVALATGSPSFRELGIDVEGLVTIR